MKAVLAHHEIGGTVDQFEAQHTARIDKFADKSLGSLVKALFESFVVPVGQEGRSPADANAPTRSRCNSGFGWRWTRSGGPPSSRPVEDLVQVRNDLVHHLLEPFDLWTDDGCVAAEEHLNPCYGRIDQHYNELHQWALTMNQATAASASFFQSDA